MIVTSEDGSVFFEPILQLREKQKLILIAKTAILKNRKDIMLNAMRSVMEHSTTTPMNALYGYDPVKFQPRMITLIPDKTKVFIYHNLNHTGSAADDMLKSVLPSAYEKLSHLEKDKKAAYYADDDPAKLCRMEFLVSIFASAESGHMSR